MVSDIKEIADCELRSGLTARFGCSVVCPNGSAAFQQLMPNYIRSFAARQLTNELDYGKCKTLCSRFKLLFQFDPPSIRDPQSAIQIISAKVFSVLRKYPMPRKRKRAIIANDAAK